LDWLGRELDEPMSYTSWSKLTYPIKKAIHKSIGSAYTIRRILKYVIVISFFIFAFYQVYDVYFKSKTLNEGVDQIYRDISAINGAKTILVWFLGFISIFIVIRVISDVSYHKFNYKIPIVLWFFLLWLGITLLLNIINYPSVNEKTLELKIHEGINKERSISSLSPLTYDDRLSSIARNHSQDMVERNYFEHNTPEGYTVSDRYAAGGYYCQAVGENIFQHNMLKRRGGSVILISFIPIPIIFSEYNDEDTLAEEIVSGWMGSEGHRKNILTPYYETEGIGVSITPIAISALWDGQKVYITEDFC
jgi:uncharacterized protein YkwD